MDDSLPTEYDAIVVGTGMTESIVAAALSRIGKSVLHLDENEYYGQLWASFNFEGIQTWINKHQSTDERVEEERNSEVGPRRSNVWNVKENWFCNEKEVETKQETEDDEATAEENDSKQDLAAGETLWSAARFMNEYRKFNLDLSPKVLFSRGTLVELLIQSNIARYAEFKCINRVLTWREGRLDLVPCSRSDVFATKNVSVVQKRMLVKLLTLCSEYPENSQEFSGFEKKTFLEFLKHKKLPDNIIHYILYAISMSTNETPCIDGIKATQAFLLSLGRYGNTPFLFPMYGSGEMSQCFCRLCAVFGGVYHLNRGVDSLVINEDDNTCVAIISNNQKLTAKHFIFSTNSVSNKFTTVDAADSAVISRGIYITDGSMLFNEKEPLTLLKFPPIENVSKDSVTVLEVGSGTHVCPEGLFVTHMTTSMTKDAESDLKHVVESLFTKPDGDEKESADEEVDLVTKRPRLLWSLTWNMRPGSTVTGDNCPDNILVCSGPNGDLDFDSAIEEAKTVFLKICPGEEFLPRAPDPDEIVFEEDENATSSENASAVTGYLLDSEMQKFVNTSESAPLQPTTCDTGIDDTTCNTGTVDETTCNTGTSDTSCNTGTVGDTTCDTGTADTSAGNCDGGSSGGDFSSD